MRKTIFIFTTLIVALLLLFQLSKYCLVYTNTTTEIIISIVVFLFLSMELFINKKRHPQINVSESLIDKEKIKALSINLILKYYSASLKDFLIGK